jgi:threonine/homoserine/homoserine lactone efflux protein
VPTTDTLLLFAGASVAVLLFPGPAVIYIVSRSAVHGRRAGLVSVLGVETGNLVHVGAAAVGVSAVIASSAAAFTVVKYAGAAYLVYLGARALLARDPGESEGSAGATRDPRLFRDGVVVAVLNPKTALFFLAFLPQFVQPGHGPAWLQMTTLGVIFVAIAVITDGLYALVSGSIGAAVRSRRGRGGRPLARASGVVYLALGASAALADDHRGT